MALQIADILKLADNEYATVASDSVCRRRSLLD
jgi:hypothetical protein